MKRNQKMTALLLGLLLLTSACANSGNNAEESAAPTAAPSADVEAAAVEEEDTYVYDDLETKDFNGWDYRSCPPTSTTRSWRPTSPSTR